MPKSKKTAVQSEGDDGSDPYSKIDPKDAVLFKSAITKETVVQGEAQKSGCCSSSKTTVTETETEGYCAVIREGGAGTLVAISQEQQSSGMLDASVKKSSFAANTSSKVDLTQVFSVRDVVWVEVLREEEAADMAAASGSCMSCISCCCAGAVDFASNKTLITKLTIWVKFREAPIIIRVDEATEDKPSDSPECCNPVWNYVVNSRKDVDTDEFRQIVLEHNDTEIAPKCGCCAKQMGCWDGTLGKSKYTITHDYFMKQSYRKKCNQATPLTSLGLILTQLMIEETSGKAGGEFGGFNGN